MCFLTGQVPVSVLAGCGFSGVNSLPYIGVVTGWLADTKDSKWLPIVGSSTLLLVYYR